MVSVVVAGPGLAQDPGARQTAGAADLNSACPTEQVKNMLSPMSAPTANVSAPAPPRWNVVTRLATILLLAFVIGWILNRVGQQLSHSPRPAGFVRGLVQGALMQASMPN